MNRRFRVGVIGVGAIATDEHYGHIPNYLKLSEVEVVALSDINGRRARAIADRFDIPHVYTDSREMLAHRTTLDAVSICTPNYLHATTAIPFLEAGIHVLVEKPMALTAADGQRMIDAARASGAHLLVGMNNRFREDVRALKLMVANGALGRVHSARTSWIRPHDIKEASTWFTSKAQSASGPLWDIGLVMLDLALWMLDFPQPVSVMGALCENVLPSDETGRITTLTTPEASTTYPVEDAAHALIRFDNGSVLAVEVSWASMIGTTDKIFLRLDGTSGAAELHNPDPDTNEPLRIQGELFGTRMAFSPRIPMSGIPSHRHELKHFVDVCRGREKLMVTPEQGLMGIQLIEAIYQSATEGRMVHFEEPVAAMRMSA
jgi:predicted dehydrogenase